MPRNRLAPLPLEACDDRTRTLLSSAAVRVAEMKERAPVADGPLDILRTIAHRPRLLEPFLAFAATLAVEGVLPRRDSELLALRTAWNCRSPFEWGHHAVYAIAAGLSEAEIQALAGEKGTADWSPRDLVLIEAADALHRNQDLDDGLWARLAEHFDAAQLVEIPFVVGNYAMLSMVANATGVPVGPELPALPDAAD